MGAAAHAQLERRCAAELAGIEQLAGEAEFESVAEPLLLRWVRHRSLLGIRDIWLMTIPTLPDSAISCLNVLLRLLRLTSSSSTRKRSRDCTVRRRHIRIRVSLQFRLLGN